jgi:hypothetical protein
MIMVERLQFVIFVPIRQVLISETSNQITNKKHGFYYEGNSFNLCSFTGCSSLLQNTSILTVRRYTLAELFDRQ